MIESDEYKRGWYDGYQAAKREQQINLPPLPYTPPISNNPRCMVCGMEFKNAMGYVCYNPNCPTKVTCATPFQGATSIGQGGEPWLNNKEEKC